MLKRLVKLTPFKLALLIGLAFGAAHLCWRVGVLPLPLLETWDAKALDAKFRLRGAVPTSGKVTVCGLDERSIQRYGLWPWRRELIGQALKNLDDAGALAVGVDMWFSDPDRFSAHRTVNALVDETLSALPEDLELATADEEDEEEEEEGLRALRAKLHSARLPDPDEVFAKLLEGCPRVVTGAAGFPKIDEGLGIPADILERDRQALERFSLADVHAYDVDPEGRRLLDWSPLFKERPAQLARLRSVEGVQASLPRITAASAHVGLVDAEQDPDGTIRRCAPFSRLGDRLVPNLSFATLAVALDAKLVALRSHFVSDSLDFVGLMGGDNAREGTRLTVPIDPFSGRYLINYPGSYEAKVDGRPLYEQVSLADAVDGTFDKARVKDHVVLVGVTAAGTFDHRVTPFDSFMPGVFIHAAVIDNVLRGKEGGGFLEFTGGLALVEVAVLLLMALAFGLLVSRLEAYYLQIALMLAMSGAYLAIDYLAFKGGVVLSTIVPLAQMLTLFVSLMVFKLVVTDREKRQVRSAFQHYLAPSVLEEMVKSPDNLRLGGVKRELTVFFSDIRGFTTISERLPAEELSKLLNEYLTPMSNLVFKHQGTLDKYMGDAIMAFWGAPLEQPDHALRACTAAVEMLKTLDALRAGWRAQGRPDIAIGIGLNSGPMSVGNMGSDMFFNYTVMGDNVNLGSRLEGTNKAYGTNILMSEFTFAHVKGKVVARELGSVRVKGKKLPVGIYELRGIGAPSPEEAAVIAEFEAGVAAYRARRWDDAEAAFRKVLAAWKDDGPSTHYLEDLEDKRRAPPPEGWDGVYEMKTK